MEQSLRYISALLFLMQQTPENYKIAHERKFWSCEIPTRKNLGPTKYPQEEIGDPRNTHEEKSETHKIPTQKNQDPQNMHQKKLRIRKIRTRKILDPQTTHKGMMAWWYETHDDTQRTKFSTLIYGEVCQKHYGKAVRYKLFWRGINRVLERVGIFLIKKWVVKVMSEQGKWKNDRY